MSINDTLLAAMAGDRRLRAEAFRLFLDMCRYRYSYNFTWLGRPIIQFPEDIVAMQEIIWSVQPDLIIETGIAHGGSLMLWASLLELMGGDRRVIGVDVEIRPANRAAIERHPLARRITMIEGSSTDPRVMQVVRGEAAGRRCPMVILDSNHSHAHVLEELRGYAPLVRQGSYLIVMDTVVEDMPAGSFPDRNWDKGNNPKTAVHQFLRECDRFAIDRQVESKLLFSVAPDGYLRCLKDPDA
jgi:cephalosporin hydroxylase